MENESNNRSPVPDTETNEPGPPPPEQETPVRPVVHYHFNILGSNVAETEAILRSLVHAVHGQQPDSRPGSQSLATDNAMLPGPSSFTPTRPGPSTPQTTVWPSSYASAGSTFSPSPLGAGPPSMRSPGQAASEASTTQILAQALLARGRGRPTRQATAVNRAAIDIASMVVGTGSGPQSSRPVCRTCEQPRADHVLSSCGHPVCFSCINLYTVPQGSCKCGVLCNAANIIKVNT